MDRDPDRARLVGDGPRDRLADPPSRVRGKLEAEAVLEAVGRLHQTHVAFLDQIEERKPSADVTLGDGDHETKVGFHKLLLRLSDLAVALLDLVEESAEHRPVDADFSE